MGTWNTFSVKTQNPEVLLHKLKEYCDEGTNPYLEESRDFELTGGIDEDQILHLTGNEIFKKERLECILNTIHEHPFEILESRTQSGLDILTEFLNNNFE